MSADSGSSEKVSVLLCFDGSEESEHAIEHAGRLLKGRRAVVVCVGEHIGAWDPTDPSPFGALVSTVGSEALGLDQIASDLEQERLARGIQLASSAGFEAQGTLADGKPWRAICELAAELDVEVVVLGARGLSPARGALTGSVSAEVAAHVGRPVLIVPKAH